MRQADGHNVTREWKRRGAALRDRTVSSIRSNIKNDHIPPYVPPLPGARSTFREAEYRDKPNKQQWAHRLYSELLQADILPDDLETAVIETLKTNGGTTAGIVADIWPIEPEGRKILGFISFSYALALLRLDRIEEFLLFMYSHRYHDHTRGSWTAMETRNIGSGTNLFCMPAQQSLPLLIRWMLLLEEPDDEILHIAKGVPRAWFAGSQTLGIKAAPTRWGRATFTISIEAARLSGSIQLDGRTAPRELHLKLRLPKSSRLRDLNVNGSPACLGGPKRETVIIHTAGKRRFEITAQLDAV